MEQLKLPKELKAIGPHHYQGSFDSLPEGIPQFIKIKFPKARSEGESICFDFDSGKLVHSLESGMVTFEAAANSGQEGVTSIVSEYCVFLKKGYHNVFEAVLSEMNDLDNELFFRAISDKHLSLSELLPYINEFEKKGLVFDLDGVDQSLDLIAIDCVDYIKFVPRSDFESDKKLDAIIDSLCLLTGKPEIIEWLSTIYLRYIKKHAHDENEINHVLDWMNRQDFDVKELDNSLSFERALSKSNQWVEFENQRLGIKSLKDVEDLDVKTVYVTSDGYALVRLISQDAKKREGIKMHNCIGKYSNGDDLYSLRARGLRVCSLDVRGNRIKELKGPWNKSVAQEHRKAVKECLDQHFKVDYGSCLDLHNIGLKSITFEVSESQSYSFVVDSNASGFKEKSVRLMLFYHGIKKEFVPAQTKSVLEIFSSYPEQVAKIETMLTESLNADYILCKYSGRLFSSHKSHIVEQLKNLDRAADLSPKWFDVVFKDYSQECDNVIDNTIHNQNPPLQKIITTVLEKYLWSKERFETEASLKGQDKIDFRKFLIDTGNLFGLRDHPSNFFAPLGLSVPKEAAAVRKITMETVIKGFFESVGWRKLPAQFDFFHEIDKVGDSVESYLGVNSVGIESKNVAIASQCSLCKNREKSKEQSRIMAELCDIEKRANSETKSILKIINEVRQFSVELGDIVEEFGSYLLRGSEFIDFNSGVIRNQSLTELKESVRFLDDHIEGFKRNFLRLNFNELLTSEKEISKFLFAAERMNDEAKGFIKELHSIKGEPCEEVDEDGELSGCRAEDTVDFNSKMELELECLYEEVSSFYKHIDELKDIYSEVKDFFGDDRDIKASVISFISSYGVSKEE